MKKLATLLLLSTVALAGCTSIQRGLRGDDYVDSSISAEESSKVAAQATKDLNDALTNENANFPQLSTEVAEDEAEVKIITTQGDIRLKLFPKYAPLAVENFLTHAKEGYYNGVIFHRIIQDFMIQGGDPTGTGMGGQSIYGEKFEDEFSPELYNIRGALSMANAGPNTNGSQFFIVQNKNLPYSAKELSRGGWPEAIAEVYASQGGTPHLDRRHTVFGQLADEASYQVLDKIAAVETGAMDKPVEDVVIETIEVED